MSNSTKRAIRTAVQAVFGVLAGLAILLPLIGSGLGVPALVAAGATVVTVSAGVSKAWALLEVTGRIPAWLNHADTTAEVTAAVETAINPDDHDH